MADKITSRFSEYGTKTDTVPKTNRELKQLVLELNKVIAEQDARLDSLEARLLAAGIP